MNQNDDELRALVATSPAAQRMLDERRVDIASEIAEGRNIVGLLRRQGPMWLKDVTPEQALAFCRVALRLGLNPLVGEAYLVHGTFYVGVAGRRKMATRTGAFRGEDPPRLLTPEEDAIYGVRKGDVARIVQVWREGHRGPTLGCGIVRAGEIEAAKKKRDNSPAVGRDGLYQAPIARDPEGMAAKRAAVAAYKKAFADLDIPTADAVGMRLVDVETGNDIGYLSDGTPLAALDDPAGDAERDAGAIDVPAGPTWIDRIAAAAGERRAGPYPPAPGEVRTMLGIDPDDDSSDFYDFEDAVEIVCDAWRMTFDRELDLITATSFVHSSRAAMGAVFAADLILPEHRPQDAGTQSALEV